MDKVDEYINIVTEKKSSEFIKESEIDLNMSIQEEQELLQQTEELLNEAAVVDFTTATRLADNEYKKNLVLDKSKDYSRLSGLKVAKTFLSKRKTQERDPQEKKVYDQKISELDVDIAKLAEIVKREPKRRPLQQNAKPVTTVTGTP